MLFWFAFLGTHLNYCTWNIPLMILILYDSLYIFIDKDADWPHEERNLELVWFLDTKPHKQWMLCHLTVLKLNTHSVCFLKFT